MLINSPNISGSLTVTGNSVISGSLTVLGSITGAITGSATSASYVEYSNVANKPTLVSGSSQVTYSGLTGIPSGIVSGSSQVTYSGLTGVPAGIVSGSAQVTGFGIFATTGSNGFNGSQSITGSLTVTGQVVAQTLNVQQVTSSIVYSSGSNIFGNTLGNTQQFTGSVSVTGSLTVNGIATSGTVSGTTNYVGKFTGTNTIGNSLFTDNGTNVGVNTTGSINVDTGWTNFTVNGSSVSLIGLKSNETNIGAMYGSAANNDFTIQAYGTTNSARMNFLTSSSLRMSVLSNGNVTIGTSNATTLRFTVAQLFSSHSMPALGSLGGLFGFFNTDTEGGDLRYGLVGDVSGATGNVSLQAQRVDGTATAYNLLLQPNGGNVGIGTTSPNEKLHVIGAITATGTATTVIASSSTIDYYSAATRFISRGTNNSTRGAYRFLLETADGSQSLDSLGIRFPFNRRCLRGQSPLPTDARRAISYPSYINIKI